MSSNLEGNALAESTESTEANELPDEIGERSGNEGTALLHGAEDPREIRLKYSEEYVEPISRAHTVEQFQDPSTNVERINPDYALDTSYRVNCADCARCYEATWRGQEQEAAGRACVEGVIEGESPQRTEEWAHQEFTETTPSDLRRILEESGPGASAIVGSHWEDGGHAYNVVNSNGELLTVDSQRGEIFPYSDKAIHPLLEKCGDVEHEAMAWDAKGTRI